MGEVGGGLPTDNPTDNYPNKYLHYDSIAWPSFCGMSATFAFWIENWGCGARAALLARYPTGTKTRDPGAWFYQIDQNPVGTKICIGQIPATGQVAHWRCVVSSVKLNCMEKLTRRHLAVVFDHLVNSIAFYVDGSLAGVLNSEVPDDKPWIRDSLGSGVGRLDCGFDTVAGYTALGHRVPGQQHYYGVIQDWRYYRGQVLSAAEIMVIARGSLRTCQFSDEGSDSNYKDMYGHDCAWYREQREQVPGMCATETIRNQCPVACSPEKNCFVEAKALKQYMIWERQMPIREFNMNLDTNGDSICVKKELDAVAECRKNKASGQTFPLIGSTEYYPGDGGNGRYNNVPPGPTTSDINVNPKVWDCDVLEKAVNPFCSFSVPGDWTKSINNEIKQNGGFTVSFWWRAMPDTSWSSIDKGQIVFYNNMSPSRVLFVIDIFGSGVGSNINYWIEVYNTCQPAFVDAVNPPLIENLNNLDGGEKFVAGQWYHVSLALGSIVNGQKSLFIMSGSQPGTIKPLSWDWCQDDSHDFIQGITVPGGVIMSPIKVTSSPLSVKQLQEEYYNTRGKFKIRRGPVSSDEDRFASIEYEIPAAGFPYPTSLVSPPIVIQKRKSRTQACDYALGTQFNKKIWDDIVTKTCASPYECPENILENATALVTCLNQQTPTAFFGQEPYLLRGESVFYEFLQSITESEVLVRNGNPEYTDSFVDLQTEAITVIMIAYSPQYGIVSTISIVGTFAAEVQMDYSIMHFLSVEGETLDEYRTIASVAFVLSIIILIEKLVTIRHLHFADYWMSFTFDLLIQVLMPIVYFAIRLVQLSDSKESILKSVGNEGLSGVPWAGKRAETVNLFSFHNSVLSILLCPVFAILTMMMGFSVQRRTSRSWTRWMTFSRI